MKIGILGGGLTGLMLGYIFDKNGIEFEILEKSHECGGLCKSIQKHGFTFDVSGGHIIFSRDKKILKFMLRFLGNNKIKIRRNTKILYKDLFVKYPFENGLSDLPKEENFECLMEFLKTLNQNYNKPRNFKEWVLQTFGKGIAEKYLIPYNEKIWKMKTEELSTFWVDGRVPKPPVEDIIKSSLGIKTEGYKHQLYFYYPKRGGIQSFVKAIERKIEDSIINRFAVKSIKRAKKYIVSNGFERREYDTLISTIPIFELLRTIQVPMKVMNALNGLRYNSLINIMIGINSKDIGDMHWLYIPDKSTMVHRLIFLKNYSPYVCPPDMSSIMAEVTYNKNIIINEKDLLDKSIKWLDKRGIVDKKNICFSEIVKTKYAYVVYDLNYEKNMKVIKEYVKKTGIYLCGRFSEFKYLNMDMCVKNAISLAEKILINYK